MCVATLTSKGQLTLPKELRLKLGLEAGDKVDFRLDEANGNALMVPLSKRTDDLFGILAATGLKTVSPEEMDEALRKKFLREKQ